ncbi:MAG: PIN domain-containing protein [Pontiellaceae bacterium]|nr:PIN domain-containing protein [Pontiellaceae bacterium]
MKIIVDTCVWSLALRRPASETPQTPVSELESLISDNRIQMIGPIRQELLSGVRDQIQFKKLEKNLRAFPDLTVTTGDYVLAAKFFNLCRANGLQGSNTDFLICAMAVQHKLSIYSTDQDFIHFAKYLPIRLHRAGD